MSKTLTFHTSYVVRGGKSRHGYVQLKLHKWWSVRWSCHSLDGIVSLSDQFLIGTQDELASLFTAWRNEANKTPPQSKTCRMSGCLRWGYGQGMTYATAMVVVRYVIDYYNRKIETWIKECNNDDWPDAKGYQIVHHELECQETIH